MTTAQLAFMMYVIIAIFYPILFIPIFAFIILGLAYCLFG